MTTDDKIRDEKQQYDINRETAKIGTLLSRKMINMNTLQVNILLCNQRRISISTEIAYHLKIKNKYLMNLLKKGLLYLLI